MWSSRFRRRPTPEVGGEPGSVAAPLAVLVVCGLLVLMQLYVAIPLAPVVGRALGDGGAPAALGTAYSIAYGLGLLVFGTLSDRHGRKAILVPGMAALAIATALLSAASSLPVVAVLRCVQGLAAASFAAATLPYVGEAFPPRWRSPGIGAVTTAFLVAGIVGQVYAEAVALVLGWRWVFGLAAPAFALAAVALATVLVEPARAGQPVGLRQAYRALGALAVRRELALPYAATATVLLSFVAITPRSVRCCAAASGWPTARCCWCAWPASPAWCWPRWPAGSSAGSARSASPSRASCWPRPDSSRRRPPPPRCGRWSSPARSSSPVSQRSCPR